MSNSQEGAKAPHTIAELGEIVRKRWETPDTDGIDGYSAQYQGVWVDNFVNRLEADFPGFRFRPEWEEAVTDEGDYMFVAGWEITKIEAQQVKPKPPAVQNNAIKRNVSMTPAEYRQALEVLGISPREFARLCGADDKGARSWVDDASDGPTPYAAFALRGLLRNFIPEPKMVSGGVLKAHIRKRIEKIVSDARAAGWQDQDTGNALKDILDAEAIALMLTPKKREG